MALLESLLLGFGIGLSGALAPGPTLLATISGAGRHGPFVGGRVAIGHLLVESVLVVALFVGLAPLVIAHQAAIALLGGVALVGFGLLTLGGARSASLSSPGGGTGAGPVFAGALTTVANPYFWIWWATLGGALLVPALASGPGDAALYLAGHGAADLGWLLFVGIGISRGASLLTDRGYRALLAACGVAMVGIGLAYATYAL
ncbi:MAG: LysE family transporter [Methanospirillum sp.]|nr:LysE family transporter [Methanospirillum sp.]